MPRNRIACFDGLSHHLLIEQDSHIDYDGLFQLFVTQDALNACRPMVKKPDIFGTAYHPHPMIIASHCVYTALKDAHMTRNLEFRPVAVVDRLSSAIPQK